MCLEVVGNFFLDSLQTRFFPLSSVFLHMTLMPDRGFVTRYWLMSCRDSSKFLMISYRRRLAKHTAELWPSPSSLSNGGVEFLSCLAATSKHRTGSYKRALISAKAPNPHSSIPPPLFPILGDGLGDSVLPERKKQTNQKPHNMHVPIVSLCKSEFLQ